MSDLLRVGPLELAVLTVLWDTAAFLTAREVQDRLSYPELAYTTVATVLGNLCLKGRVVRRKDRRRWCYRAAQRREEYLAACIRALLAEAPDPAEVLTLAAGLPGEPAAGGGAWRR